MSIELPRPRLAARDADEPRVRSSPGL